MDYAAITNSAFLTEFKSIQKNEETIRTCHFRYSNAIENLCGLAYELDNETDPAKKASILHRLNVHIVRTHIEFLMYGISNGYDPHNMHKEIFSALQKTADQGIIPAE